MNTSRPHLSVKLNYHILNDETNYLRSIHPSQALLHIDPPRRLKLLEVISTAVI